MPILGGGSFGGAPPWMAREESPSSSIRVLVVLEKTAQKLGFGDNCENNLGYTPTPFSLEKAVFLLSQFFRLKCAMVYVSFFSEWNFGEIPPPVKLHGKEV